MFLIMMLSTSFFFFSSRRRHTRWNCDWSSDVCSSDLAAVAHGTSRSLIERAADVILKERRTLLLVPRETPLSLVHLRNLTLATETGAIVLPAAPGFYHKPQQVRDLVDFVVQRVLDQLGLDINLVKRWEGK